MYPLGVVTGPARTRWSLIVGLALCLVGTGKGEEASAGIPQQMGEVLRIPEENPQLLGRAWEKVDLNPSVGQSGTGSASGQRRGRAAKIRGGHASAEGSPLFSQGRCCRVSPAAT